ncbi:MAG: hypothetical protein ACLTX9_09170 [Oscillospiraceae bacterium]|jgi:hypothetical protein
MTYEEKVRWLRRYQDSLHGCAVLKKVCQLLDPKGECDGDV